MTAALLAADHVQDRRAQLRREESRREFLQPLAAGETTDCEVALADRPLAEARPAAERPPETRQQPSPAPAASDPSPAPGPQSAIPHPQSAIDEPAREFLCPGRVRDALSGKSPSKRNRDIFRAVVVAHRSQVDVAREYGITQPRVNQILRQVTRWMASHVVEQDEARSPLEQIQIAENLVRMQYDHLYATALDLLYGRGGEAPATEGQEAPRPHKPSPAFLNVAVRVLDAKVKFEGIGQRGLRRAIDEATQRGVSVFGPTNDHLKRPAVESDDQPDDDSENSPSYNPLYSSHGDEGDASRGIEDVTEAFRMPYEKFPEWFPGDFEKRAASYRSEAEAVFGPIPEDEDPQEEEASRLEWILEMDLMGAAAHQEAQKRIHPEPDPARVQDRLRDVRRRLLILIVQADNPGLNEQDAAGLLNECDYDEASGRFGWDRRFLGTAQAGCTQGCESAGGDSAACQSPTPMSAS